MIDILQRIAQRMSIFRLPSVFLGLLSLISLLAIIFLPAPLAAAERFVIPCFVSLLWAISSYLFIVTFRSVPRRNGALQGSYNRLKLAIRRAWYWFIGIIFLATTAAILVMTSRLISVWLGDYSG